MNNDIMSTPSIVYQFEEIRGTIKLLNDKCSDIIINSADSHEKGIELAKKATKVISIIETKRKEITKPLDEKKKEVKSYTDGLTAELSEGLSSLRNKLKQYEMKLEEDARELRKAKEQEEENRRKLQEQLLNNAPREEIAETIMQLKQIDEPPTEKTSLRSRWLWEVVDNAMIPRQYLIPDTKAINEAVRSGVREIEGIRIYEDKQLVLR
jgi:chromosome segregation ATPase